jgi:DNA-binding LacI/PurR family transcriptional regulator
MALVVPDFGMAGDIASEKGFLEAVDSRLGTPAYAHIVRHDGTARSIKAKLDALLGSGEPPTALLVARTNFVFAVIMHLLNRGIGVPGSISFIARDSDPIFESIDPPLAHYTFRSDTYIRQLCRLMLQMITQRPDPKATLIEPTFFAGRTVNPR